MRYLLLLLISSVLLATAAPARAGWVHKDRYDPETPGLFTPVLHVSSAVGMHWTRDLLSETTARVTLSQSAGVGVLVLPYLAPELRVGWGIQGARAPIEGEDAYAGYRTLPAFLDAGVNVEGRYGRLFGFGTIFDMSSTRGLYGSGWQGVPTDYGHVALGFELRGGGALPPKGEQSSALSLQIEYRRSRFELEEPAAFAPSSGWGDTLLVSVGTYTLRPNKEEK